MAVVEEDWTYPDNKTVDDLTAHWHGRIFTNGILVAGMVMEVRTRNGDATFLIGDVNEQMGVCDDCRGVEPSDIVIRYKTVWRP